MSSSSSETPAKRGRVAQILQTYQLTKQSDPRIGLILVGILLVVLLAVLGIAYAIGARGWSLLYWGFIGLILGVLAATVVFGRRAERAAYSQIEGQPGAAAAALGSLRSGWFTTPAVAVTKNQDIVHRVVGKPGVILVSEGPSSRATALLATERKRTARWVPDIPIHEIQCGNDAGQVPLRKVNSTVMKLPRALNASEVTAVRKRLEAVSTPPMPIPKGPLPKGGKIPKGMRG